MSFASHFASHFITLSINTPPGTEQFLVLRHSVFQAKSGPEGVLRICFCVFFVSFFLFQKTLKCWPTTDDRTLTVANVHTIIHICPWLLWSALPFYPISSAFRYFCDAAEYIFQSCIYRVVFTGDSISHTTQDHFTRHSFPLCMVFIKVLVWTVNLAFPGGPTVLRGQCWWDFCYVHC